MTRRRAGSGLPGACARRAAVVAALAVVACRGHDSPTESSPVVAVTIAVTQPTILVGNTTTVVATLLDAAGKVVSDRAPVWSSLTPTVVSVMQDGEVTGLQSGTGQVRATSGRASADATVIVNNPTAAAIQLARDTASLFLPGGTVQAIAAVTDAGGKPLSKPTIAWTSSAPQIATVNIAGLVTAVASGSAVITAAVDGLSATMSVTVRPLAVVGAPTIASVAPATLRPGAVTIVTGSNFASSLAGNQVAIDGIAATVVAATTTQLSVIVPSVGFTCDPTRDAFMQVTANGLIGGGTVPLQVAMRRELAPGQSVIVANLADVRCNELVPADGRWVISVYNASRAAVTPATTANALFAVRGVAGPLASNAGDGPARLIARSGLPVAAPAPSVRPSPLSVMERERLATHASVLERNITAAAMQQPALARGSAPAAGPSSDIATVGAVTQIKIPNLDAADFCVTNTPIGFRTAYVGPHIAIVEDTTSVLNGTPTQRGRVDDLMQRLGDEFEAVMWPIVTTYFGNPLAMDAVLGGPGRVVLAISPRVNAMQHGTVTAFVASCDDFAVAQRPSSNLGAFVYGVAPTSAATGYATSDSRDQWLRNMRSTLVHETKHATAFAERISRGLALEDLGWEEGGARAAEELYARTFYHTSQGGNTGFAASLGCDIRYADAQPPCAGRPVLLLRHFDALYGYMSGPELNTPLGRPFTGDFNFYAGAWSLLRWAADQFGADEAKFFKDFVTSPVTGVSNLEARTGKKWEDLLGEWSLAVYLDDIGGFTPANPALAIRSWNYPDIWLGMCATMGPCNDPSNPVLLYLRSTPFAPRQRSFGNFLIGYGSLIGGGFTILDLSGPGAPSQVIEVKALTSEANAPANIRIAFARVR